MIAADHHPSRNNPIPEALLLLGPTGSGKTPLGAHLQAAGMNGRRCLHFDFGEQLRKSAATDDTLLTPKERIVVGRVLHTGALLENADFTIAEKLLTRFLRENGFRRTDLVILNGLPRHTGQADHVSRFLHIRWVVVLECSARTVLERIRRNTGGDRTGRSDDSESAVEHRLRRFLERTRPLIEHYEKIGSAVLRIPVEGHTDAERIHRIWLKDLPAGGTGNDA